MKRRSFLKNTTLLTAASFTLIRWPIKAEGLKASPTINAARVAPNILGITIRDGELVRGRQEPYQVKPGDEIKFPKGDYIPDNTPQLWRNGVFTGWLVENKKTLTVQEKIIHHLSATGWLNDPKSFTVQSSGDPSFKQGIHPRQISRKSMPQRTINQIAGQKHLRDAIVDHTIYLHFEQNLLDGKEYLITFQSDIPPFKVKISDAERSEAIHVSQIGFEPEDEIKVAFMSCWLGTGGKLSQKDNIPFYIANSKGEKVMSGKGRVTKRADENESSEDSPGNLNLTDVVMFDFSDLKTPGIYHVIVPGVGSSYPVLIEKGIWLKAFTQTMKYFYYQRSGLELKPPYTDFHRPRNIHPDDGVKIYHSTCPLLNSGNGLNAMGNDVGNFANLVAGKTDIIVSDAWGGYADSGDWDRRIQHLYATRLKLDLLIEGGILAEQIKLNIPESGNGMPDILNEALWNLDFYRRIMTPEGGVRGGVEAEEHPKTGEGSWQESWIHFAYAPDAWSSYLFVAAAARCAYYATDKFPELAAVYKEAATKAMNWAEKELVRLPEDYRINPMRPGVMDNILQTRNLAAADMYRLTGDQQWHQLFLSGFDKHSSEAEWVYLQTKQTRDETKLAECRKSFLEKADNILKEQNEVGFRWTRSRAGAEKRAWGMFQRKPGSEQLLRAWQLTKKPEYRIGAILSAQMSLGANPNNKVYTSGMGHNPMKNPLYLDAEVQGKEPPAGIPVFGPFNPQAEHVGFNKQMQRVAPFFVPEYKNWPMTEFCLDSGQVHSIDEHLPDLTGSVIYLYGSLANK